MAIKCSAENPVVACDQRAGPIPRGQCCFFPCVGCSNTELVVWRCAARRLFVVSLSSPRACCVSRLLKLSTVCTACSGKSERLFKLVITPPGGGCGLEIGQIATA